MDGGEINQVHQAWFEARGISLETLIATGIYTGKRQSSGDKWEVVPDGKGKVLVYPYYRFDKVVNEKYREPGKVFYQKPGGQKVFWNADLLDDFTLQNGENFLVITEGENDALAAIEAGHPFVVSVPDGAPPPRNGPLDDIDPEHDDKYQYIFNDWAALKQIKHIVIAVDNDDPGKRLAEELVRRLGRVRCSFAAYPEGCKDLNEVLIKHGKEEVLAAIKGAKPYPVDGLFRYSELPPPPEFNFMSTGFGRLDGYLQPYIPALMVVTGHANHGKSTWINQVLVQMNLLHGIKVAMLSLETEIDPFISKQLAAVYYQWGGKGDWKEYIDQNFFFICPEPGRETDIFDIPWLLEKATASVIRFGTKVLLIDPWNEIEHSYDRRKHNFSDYIGRAIRDLKRFAKEFKVLVIIVAHPAKEGARKDPMDLTLYDVADSANFNNKADFGVVIGHIEGSNESNIKIVKIRHKGQAGQKGIVPYTFDPHTGTFDQ